MESGAESTRDTLTFHAISSFSETEIVCTYILLGTSDGKDQVPQNLGLCFWKWQFQFKKSIWNVDQFVVKCLPSTQGSILSMSILFTSSVFSKELTLIEPIRA